LFDKNSYVKAQGWSGAPRRIPVRGEEINWVHAYQRQMRKFSLEVILAALSALNDIDRMVVHRRVAFV